MNIWKDKIDFCTFAFAASPGKKKKRTNKLKPITFIFDSTMSFEFLILDFEKNKEWFCPQHELI